MKAQCLPFSQIPHTSKLFTDFISWKSPAQQFYSRPPHIREWVKEEAVNLRYDSARREKVCNALERQNKGWNASAKTLENIQRLRSGAAAAVTGQQVGLFGGPLFSIFKALFAVKLAEEATAAGVDCVPVFWLATQDHDFAEVDHVAIPGNDALKTFTAPVKHSANVPVGGLVLDAAIEDVVGAAIESLGESEASAWLRAYHSGETFGDAFAHLFAQIFGDWGVILLDARDPGLNAIAAPIYQAAIEQAGPLEVALRARGKALETAGYDQQVKVVENSTLLFALEGGARVPIHRQNSSPNFSIAGNAISQADLLQQIQSTPQNFSPNVLLRPIVQDYLLPTLVYTGGAAEVAYFAQAGVVYEALVKRITPIMPRFSATLVEPRPQSLLKRYHLDLPDLFAGPEVLREKLATHALPKEFHAAFDAAEASLSASLEPIRTVLTALDKTLVDSANTVGEKMRYQLEQLRAKAARAELRQTEVLGRHAELLSQALFPNKNLQEREIGGIYFLARYGKKLLEDLYGCIHTDCLDHQVIQI